MDQKNTSPNAEAFLQSSLSEQIDLIKSRRVTSVQLTEAYIEHIKAVNPKLNIVVNSCFDQALTRAKELDQKYLSESTLVGRLHGIPFTLKDAFRVQGIKTTYGWPGFQYLPAKDSCTLVDRLLNEGAVLIGQTNVPFSCFDWQTNSPIYGLTRNPLDRERTVGGSSGGSAASIAAHFSPFEIGSDVAGSIRNPAHCCGVFGLRPTHDFVPFSDVGPSVHPQAFKNLAVAGPIGRNLDDLKIVLSVLTQSKDNGKTQSQLNLAYTLDWPGTVLSTNSRNRLLAYLEKVAKSHSLLEIKPNIDFERCLQVWGTILGFEYKQMIPSLFRAKFFMKGFNHFFNTRRFHQGPFKDCFQKGLLANLKTYQSALDEAEDLRKQFFDELKPYDLWITPTAPTEAIPHQKTGSPQIIDGKSYPYECIGKFLMATALFHHPILVKPLKEPKDNLPIGIQLHGKPQGDWQLLADARLL